MAKWKLSESHRMWCMLLPLAFTWLIGLDCLDLSCNFPIKSISPMHRILGVSGSYLAPGTRFSDFSQSSRGDSWWVCQVRSRPSSSSSFSSYYVIKVLLSELYNLRCRQCRWISHEWIKTSWYLSLVLHVYNKLAPHCRWNVEHTAGTCARFFRYLSALNLV